MPRAPLLDDATVDDRLRALPMWRRDGTRIVRTVRVATFRDAVELVARITPIADEQDHHPDVSIHWNELTFTLWTHASGGLTERDFRLADAIDRIMEAARAEA